MLLLYQRIKAIQKYMDKKAGIIILILVILSVILFIAFGQKKENSSSDQEGRPERINKIQQMENMISLTNQGFSPSTITVKTETPVIWRNDTKDVASINSADHPTHLIYPKLNLGEFASGQFLTIAFDKPGTYRYHNHYNPEKTGAIVVTK